jgi:chitin disaccharide deacetylase
MPLDTKSSNGCAQADASVRRDGAALHAGLLIINADDWGRDHENTERTLECILRRTVSSVSAMVFMEDSEKAAGIARERGIDAGLHLNFTTAFSAPGTPARLIEHQERVSRYLGRHRFAQVVFHPGLASSFEYIVKAQLDEFFRLYGAEPTRLDGHHHMHLCSNVLLGGFLPAGTLVRRNFSFQPREKSLVNRLYRNAVDLRLARRHRIVDFFFSLPPLDPPSRLQRIFSLANQFTVEVETHPVSSEEYSFLMGVELLRLTANTRIAPRFAIPGEGCGRRIDARRS